MDRCLETWLETRDFYGVVVLPDLTLSEFGMSGIPLSILACELRKWSSSIKIIRIANKLMDGTCVVDRLFDCVIGDFTQTSVVEKLQYIRQLFRQSCPEAKLMIVNTPLTDRFSSRGGAWNQAVFEIYGNGRSLV